MKVNKFLMLGIAGLAFAACSNDENVTGGNIDGNGMVEISIVSPATKAIDDASTGSSIVVGGTITVEVYSGEDLQGTATISRDTPDDDEQQTYTARIYDVSNPTKVVAYVNDGKAVYDDVDIEITDAKLLDINPVNIPAYGETALSAANLSGEMEKPETGVIYDRYVASVALKIPVARLELANLKHKEHDDVDSEEKGDCKFSTLKINGVYLNNIYVKKNDATPTATYSWNETSVEGEGNFPILYDLVGVFGEGENFLQTQLVEEQNEYVSFPGEGQAFAYNIFAGEGKALPELRVYFNEAESTSEELKEPRYAIVTSYKDAQGQPITSFEPGVIYRITNAELQDKNIGPNEDGEDVYGVEVTVTEASWTVTDIKADWVEQ